MRYENELCKGCGLKFMPDDDAVVCPVCGTPQHRHCWQEHGGCVNASLHAEGFAWQFSASAENNKTDAGFNASADTGVICSACGTNNPPGTEVCQTCKANLNSGNTAENGQEPVYMPFNPEELPFLKNAGIAPDEVIGGIKANDIALYTQMSAKRYIEKFRRMDNTGMKISWNWAAFFFSPYWFFYRKLYWLGGIFLGLKLAIAIIFAAPMLEFQNIIYSISEKTSAADISGIQAQAAKYMPYILGVLGLTFLINFISALLANQAYKKKVTKELASIRRFAKDENVFRMLTIRRGGASPLALLASLFGYNLLFSMLKIISGWI